MAWLVFIVAGLWFLFGDPPKDVANWFWPEDAAPWETVDAYYYPDRDDLRKEVHEFDLASVEECRSWVNDTAYRHNDAGLRRGDYECAVQRIDDLLGIPVYRITVK